MPKKPPKKTAASRKPPKNALPRKTKAGIKPKTGSAEPPAPPRRSTAIEVAAPEPVAQGVGFPVVGVGASAGGLEAFTPLLQRLPADTGMAFVLVQHLHPEYESALTEIQVLHQHK